MNRRQLFKVASASPFAVALQSATEPEVFHFDLDKPCSQPGPTFCEISGRNTGKTKRLIRRVVGHMVAGDRVVVVAAGNPYDDLVYTSLKLRILQELWLRPDVSKVVDPDPPVVRLLDFHALPDYLRGYGDRWFFDEFDHIEGCPYFKGAYYCSTLKKLRSPMDIHGRKTLFSKLWQDTSVKDGTFLRFKNMETNPCLTAQNAKLDAGYIFEHEVMFCEDVAGYYGKRCTVKLAKIQKPKICNGEVS